MTDNSLASRPGRRSIWVLNHAFEALISTVRRGLRQAKHPCEPAWSGIQLRVVCISFCADVWHRQQGLQSLDGRGRTLKVALGRKNYLAGSGSDGGVWATVHGLLRTAGATAWIWKSICDGESPNIRQPLRDYFREPSAKYPKLDT